MKAFFENTWLIGQIFGVIIALQSFFIYTMKSRGKILIAKLISDGLYMLQNLMIGTFTGAMLNGLNVLRSLVFYLRGTRREKLDYAILVLFLCLTLISPALTWAGSVSLFPAAGSAIAVVGYFMKDAQKVRYLGLGAHGLWLLYGILALNLGTVLCNVILIASAILGIVQEKRARAK